MPARAFECQHIRRLARILDGQQGTGWPAGTCDLVYVLRSLEDVVHHRDALCTFFILSACALGKHTLRAQFKGEHFTIQAS